ncbi:hypothetical protein BGX26_007129, partial [Mortierella sp. AD094]
MNLDRNFNMSLNKNLNMNLNRNLSNKRKRGPSTLSSSLPLLASVATARALQGSGEADVDAVEIGTDSNTNQCSCTRKPGPTNFQEDGSGDESDEHLIDNRDKNRYAKALRQPDALPTIPSRRELTKQREEAILKELLTMENRKVNKGTSKVYTTYVNKWK